MAWEVQDAKARFSEFLDATLRDGPQVVTRRGVEAAVFVPIDEWRRLKQAARPTLKELLLDPGSGSIFRFPSAVDFAAANLVSLHRCTCWMRMSYQRPVSRNRMAPHSLGFKASQTISFLFRP